MNRGEVWLAEAGRKRRPVVVLTRSEVLDVRDLVTVAEITSVNRGLTVEVPVPSSLEIDDPGSVINCDGIHTVPQRTLTTFVGAVDEETMHAVCRATAYAIGCD